ncbi:MAG TPA: four helix bundle protein [Longimicrobiales bacterium]
METSSPGPYGPERLRVYHLALAFARELDATLRRVRVDPSLANHLVRAAESIILNVSEGSAHLSPGRKRYHYQVAYASAGECIGALARLKDRYPRVETRSLVNTAKLISKMLHRLMANQRT